MLLLGPWNLKKHHLLSNINLHRLRFVCHPAEWHLFQTSRNAISFGFVLKETHRLYDHVGVSLVLEMDEAPDSRLFSLIFTFLFLQTHQEYRDVLRESLQSLGKSIARKTPSRLGGMRKDLDIQVLQTIETITILEYHSEFSIAIFVFFAPSNSGSLQVLVWDGCRCNWSAFLDVQWCQ